MRIVTAASLKSPAVIAAGVALTLFFGVFSFFRLPLEWLPEIERPQIVIDTDWRSQTPREVESLIVEPEEQVLQGLPGLQHMEGHAGFGQAHIVLTFPLGANMDNALSDVVGRLNRIQSLPQDAQKPLAQLANTRDRSAVLLSVFLQQLPGTGGDAASTLKFVRGSVVPTLQAIAGVGTVRFTGDGVADELQILFNPMRAAQLNIQIPKLASQIGNSDDVSGGALDVGRHKYGLSFRGRYAIGELKHTVLDWRSGNPVLLGDIAAIRVGRARNDGFAYYDGKPAIEIDVFRAAGANALSTVAQVKTAIDGLNDGDAKSRNLVLKSAGDPTEFVTGATGFVVFDVMLGMALAIGVLWFFLGEWHATLVVASAIPVCLSAVLIVMQLFGLSLNVVSLAALAVCTGIILDASIVVIENILRLRESGVSDVQSAHDGAHQAWRALFASAAANIAIFLPAIFLDSVAGQLFSAFAVTIVCSVAASFVVGIVVAPVASVLFMRTRVRTHETDAAWRGIADWAMSLTQSPRERRLWIAGLIAASVGGVWLFFLSLDYLPQVKHGVVTASLEVPPGATQDYVERQIAQPLIGRVAPFVSREGPVADWYLKSDPSGKLSLTFWMRRAGDAGAFENRLRSNILKGLPDTDAFAGDDNLFGGYAEGGALSINIQSQNGSAMRAAARRGFDALEREFPGAPIDAEPGLELDSPQIELRPNDRAIAEAGWTRPDIAALVQALGQGLYIGQRFEDGEQLYLILKSAGTASPAALQNTPVATAQGSVVYFGKLVSFRRTLDESGIYTLDGVPTYALDLQPTAERGMANVLDRIRSRVEPQIRAALPTDGIVSYGAGADDLESALRALAENIVLAIVLLVVIMAALFRSPGDAAIAAVGLPLGALGGVLAIRAVNLFVYQPLDLFATMGFVVVLGLAVSNTILIVGGAREAERAGLPREKAVRTSLETRLRPILTSTAVIVAGMLPLLVIAGPGAEVYRGLSAVIIGGILVSHFFTIVLMPALLRANDWLPGDVQLFSRLRLIRRHIPTGAAE